MIWKNNYYCVKFYYNKFQVNKKLNTSKLLIIFS